MQTTLSSAIAEVPAACIYDSIQGGEKNELFIGEKEPVIGKKTSPRVARTKREEIEDEEGKYVKPLLQKEILSCLRFVMWCLRQMIMAKGVSEQTKLKASDFMTRILFHRELPRFCHKKESKEKGGAEVKKKRATHASSRKKPKASLRQSTKSK